MSDAKRPKILAIEDDQAMQDTYETLALADGRLELLQAFTYVEALEMVEAHHATLAAVIADGQLPPRAGEPIDRGPHGLRMHALIGHLRHSLDFKGPILVTTGADVHAKRMMEAGGTETCDKAYAIDRALTLLGRGGLKLDGSD